VIEGEMAGDRPGVAGVRRFAVVLADPDPHYRALAALALRASGRIDVVGETGDGSETVALATRLRPGAVVLEAELESLDGFGVVERLTRDCYQGAVVMLSAHPPEDLDLGHRFAAASSPADGAPPGPGWAPRHDHTGPVGYRSKRAPITELADDLLELVQLLSALQVQERARMELEASPQTPRAARRFVVDRLDEWGCSDAAEVVTLLVSELASNAAEHAGRNLQIQLSLPPGVIRVEVIDPLDTIPIRRRAEETDIGGRGFDIVETLSSAWGVSPGPQGKSIWFEVPRPPRQAP
jgi:anti-sigma regulatory factor (Ser/Thr protein kinase)/CheY-like chemotaxis protein